MIVIWLKIEIFHFVQNDRKENCMDNLNKSRLAILDKLDFKLQGTRTPVYSTLRMCDHNHLMEFKTIE